MARQRYRWESIFVCAIRGSDDERQTVVRPMRTQEHRPAPQAAPKIQRRDAVRDLSRQEKTRGASQQSALQVQSVTAPQFGIEYDVRMLGEQLIFVPVR